MSHWLKLSRALDHVDALDRAIKGWLAGDSYRFVKEYDTETRRVAIVARISEPIPPAWGPMIGDVVHNLRSALDHLAFALNAKGYADANNGATLPEKAVNDSEFPIFGHGTAKLTAKDAFDNASRKYAHMDSAAQAVITKLQPYQRGAEFASDPLWVVHELSRIDKHREPLTIAFATPSWQIRGGMLGGPSQLGNAGPVEDGFALHWWTSPHGPSEADPEFKVTREIAFADGTEARYQPVVPTLRGLRDYIRFKVAFPLDKWL